MWDYTIQEWTSRSGYALCETQLSPICTWEMLPTETNLAMTYSSLLFGNTTQVSYIWCLSLLQDVARYACLIRKYLGEIDLFKKMQLIALHL